MAYNQWIDYLSKSQSAMNDCSNAIDRYIMTCRSANNSIGRKYYSIKNGFAYRIKYELEQLKNCLQTCQAINQKLLETTQELIISLLSSDRVVRNDIRSVEQSLRIIKDEKRSLVLNKFQLSLRVEDAEKDLLRSMALHNRLLSDNSEKDDISAITAVAGIAGGLVAVFGAPVAAVGLVAASVIDGACIAGAVSGVGTSIVMQSLKHSQSAIDNSSDYESEMRRNLEITEDKHSKCCENERRLQQKMRIENDRKSQYERESNKYKRVLDQAVGKDRLLKQMIEDVGNFRIHIEHMCTIDVNEHYPQLAMHRMTDSADAVFQYIERAQRVLSLVGNDDNEKRLIKFVCDDQTFIDNIRNTMNSIRYYNDIT